MCVRLLRNALLALLVLLCASPVSAAVAFQACTESHTGTTGSTSEASFNISHTPGGTPNGAIVFTFVIGIAADYTSGVTYDGEAMTAVSGGVADGTGISEPGYVKTYLIGSGINSTSPATVTISRTNNAQVMYAVVCTFTAAAEVEVYTSGIVTVLNSSIDLTEQSVNDGSPGTNSLRFAAVMGGPNSVPPVGANTTAGPDIDLGAQTCEVGYETTPGQGSRSVGYEYTVAEDAIAIHMAVREVPVGGGGPPSGSLGLLGVGK